MVMHNLKARVHNNRVLSKLKPSLKSQILKENIKSMTGHIVYLPSKSEIRQRYAGDSVNR
jgi:hypothetical protein